MKALYSEIRARFPEIHSRIYEGDEELPYVLMGYVAEWLKDLPAGGITPEISKRVVAFCQWCEQQPRGDDASDDPLTVLVVGFYEPLFDAPATRALLPKLITREEMTKNAEYLKGWVGQDNYNAALKEFRNKP